MKLFDRELVDSTTPPIYIGHRYHHDPATGEVRVSGKWHAEYNHDGRKYHEPLKTTNKAVAIKAVWAIIQRLDRGEARQARPRIAWEEFQSAYLIRGKDRGLAPPTIRKYTQITTEFSQFAQGRGRTRPEQVTSEDFWAFRTHMTTNGLDYKSQYTALTIVKQWFKWGHRKKKWFPANPFDSESLSKPKRKEQPTFTPEQVPVLLKAAERKDWLKFYLLAHLGLRFGELRDLSYDDIDFARGDHGAVHICHGGSNGGPKTPTGDRWIPLTAEVRKVLDAQPRSEHRRVCSAAPTHKHPGPRPLVERQLLGSLKSLCRQCGFEPKYNLHSFRRTFASMLASNKETSQHCALRLMGHARSEVFDQYVTVYESAGQRAIQAIQYGIPESDTSAGAGLEEEIVSLFRRRCNDLRLNDPVKLKAFLAGVQKTIGRLTAG